MAARLSRTARRDDPLSPILPTTCNAASERFTGDVWTGTTCACVREALVGTSAVRRASDALEFRGCGMNVARTR